MDTRQQILDVGRELLVEDGLRAITTNAIAQLSRVSKKTLYQHFPTKDALIEEILVSFMEENLRPWDAILESDEPAIERILASLRFVGEFLPLVQSRIINQVEAVAPHLWEAIDAIRMQRLQKLMSLVTDAQEEGCFRCDVNPDHWILLLTGVVRSVLNPTVLLRIGVPLTEIVASVQTIYFDGLLTEKGRLYVASKDL